MFCPAIRIQSAVSSAAGLPSERASQELTQQTTTSINFLFSAMKSPRLFRPVGIRSRARPHGLETLQQLVTVPRIAEQEELRRGI